jgi:Ni,Fe-hydrogenase III large subunit
MLKMINPKQFNQMLDNPEGLPSMAREMIEKYTKEMKGDRVNMIQDLIGTGRRIKKIDDDLVNYKIKIVEDMVSKGVDRATAKQMAETLADMVAQGARKKSTPKITDEGLLEMENIGKNLATQDRKLNASGGIAHLLGE